MGYNHNDAFTLCGIVHRIRFHSMHNRVDGCAAATATTTAMAHRSSITHTFISDNYMVFVSIRSIIAVNYTNYRIMTTNDTHTDCLLVNSHENAINSNYWCSISPHIECICRQCYAVVSCCCCCCCWLFFAHCDYNEVLFQAIILTSVLSN